MLQKPLRINKMKLKVKESKNNSGNKSRLSINKKLTMFDPTEVQLQKDFHYLHHDNTADAQLLNPG